MGHLIAEITYFCPAKCGFCIVEKSNAKMSLQEFCEVLSVFSKLCDKLTISGGEPSTVVDLSEYVSIAKELGYTVTVVTNAFNPKIVLSTEADLIEVSLDGFGENHESSRGIVGIWKNVLKLLEDERSIIRFTLNDNNLQDLVLLRKTFKDKEILVMPQKGIKVSQKTILEVINKDLGKLPVRCPVGKQFVVTPYGEVLPCIFYRKSLGHFKELDLVLKNLTNVKKYPCSSYYWWSQL
ncbi:MAG: radical SAM protein [Candidatus Bathyarchaeia archaeon]